jgi:hypothetical protein
VRNCGKEKGCVNILSRIRVENIQKLLKITIYQNNSMGRGKISEYVCGESTGYRTDSLLLLDNNIFVR